MKKTLTASLLAGALLLVAVSCNQDKTLYYNITEMGKVQDGKIISDGGLTYIVTENMTEYTLDKDGRVLFLIDILQTAEADYTYNVRLNSIFSVPTPAVIQEADLPSEADDAIRVNTAWFGGGYLNLSLGYLVHSNTEVEHKVNIVEQHVENGLDTLFLRIYHDAGGEIWDGSTTLSETEMGMITDYYSVPIESFIPESDSRPLKLTYSWYTYENDEVVSPTKPYHVLGELTK